MLVRISLLRERLAAVKSKNGCLVLALSLANPGKEFQTCELNRKWVAQRWAALVSPASSRSTGTMQCPPLFTTLDEGE